MKRIQRILNCTISLMFLFTNLSSGQESEFSLHREIHIFEDSETEEIKTNIEESILKLYISITSTILAGDVTIEIFDPNGERQGNFSIGSQLKSKKISVGIKEKVEKGKYEKVHGRIDKVAKDPIKGNWIIKIIPVQAKGKVIINTRQIFDDN